MKMAIQMDITLNILLQNKRIYAFKNLNPFKKNFSDNDMEKRNILFLLIGVILVTHFCLVVAETDYLDLDEYSVEYKYDEQDVETGARFSLEVTLTNEDDVNRTGVVLELDDSTPFDISGDDTLEVDVLTPGESITKTFKIIVDDDAENKRYDLDFIIEDDDDDYDDSFEIKVNSDKPDIFIGDIASSPSTLMPDSEDVKITLTLENAGETDARFVQVNLVLPEGVSPSNSYADRVSIGSLYAGDSREIDFYVDIAENVNSGNLEAELELTYESENDDNLKDTLKFNIPIKGKPQFKITSAIVSPAVPTQGETVSIAITLANIGEDDGEETSIRIFENSDQPFEFNEKTRYIGSIDHGYSGTAVFSFDVDKKAIPNTYLVKVQIRTVSEGSVFVQEETVNIKVRENDSVFEISPLWTIVIVVALIMFLLSYVVFRRR